MGGCRSSLLDCGFGELCNSVTGECYQASGAYCSPCDMGSNQWDDLGTETTCDDVLLGNEECGAGEGNFCMDWYTGEATCYVRCMDQEDCPGGYQCFDAAWSLPQGCAESGLSLGSACFSDGCGTP